MLKLEIKNLSCKIKGRNILKGLSASFNGGEMIAILGKNGAGKTTAIRCIAGLQNYKGQIFLTDDGNKLDRSSIVYLPQLEKITSSITAFETILLGLTGSLGWKVRDDQLERVSRIISELNLGEFSDVPVKKLSGGQKQLVFLAQAFVSEPRLLLLDEPTSALDIRHQLVVMQTVSNYCKKTGAIALFVLHDLMLAARYSDYVLLLNQGGVYGFDKPESLINSQTIDPLYRIESIIESNSRGFTTLTPVKPL